MESATGYFSWRLPSVAGEKMEWKPDSSVFQSIRVPVIKHFVGRTDVGIHGPIVKSNAAAVDGIIDILSCIGDRISFAVPKTGRSGRDIGCGMVKVNLHILIVPKKRSTISCQAIR